MLKSLNSTLAYKIFFKKLINKRSILRRHWLKRKEKFDCNKIKMIMEISKESNTLSSFKIERN